MLIPLDATNQVPLTHDFVDRLSPQFGLAGGGSCADVLAAQREGIEFGVLPLGSAGGGDPGRREPLVVRKRPPVGRRWRGSREWPRHRGGDWPSEPIRDVSRPGAIRAGIHRHAERPIAPIRPGRWSLAGRSLRRLRERTAGPSTRPGLRTCAMAAIPRLIHDQGMSLRTRVPVAVELGTAADLRRAIGLLAPAALLFAVRLRGRVDRLRRRTHGRARDWFIIAARRELRRSPGKLLDRGRVQSAAALLLTVLMLVLPVILACGPAGYSSSTRSSRCSASGSRCCSSKVVGWPG